jgi:hypothetical protein
MNPTESEILLSTLASRVYPAIVASTVAHSKAGKNKSDAIEEAAREATLVASRLIVHARAFLIEENRTRDLAALPPSNGNYAAPPPAAG